MIAAGVLALQATDPESLVRVRSVLFTQYLTPAAFDADPATLLASGFRLDGADERRGFRRTLDSLPGWRARLASFEQIPDPLVRAQTIVTSFSTYGARITECGTAPRLVDRLSNPGCCSDHAETFITLASAAGLTVREVHSNVHTVAEVWDPAARHWVMIDPMFGLFTRDAAGRRLSLSELRAARLRGEPVQIETFRPVALTATAEAVVHGAYDSARVFVHPRFTFGTNALAEERLRARLSPMPKVVARLIGYVLGVTPTYRMLVDDTNRASAARLGAARDGMWSTLALIGLGTTLWPASALAAAVRRRRQDSPLLAPAPLPAPPPNEPRVARVRSDRTEPTQRNRRIRPS